MPRPAWIVLQLTGAWCWSGLLFQSVIEEDAGLAVCKYSVLVGVVELYDGGLSAWQPSAVHSLSEFRCTDTEPLCFKSFSIWLFIALNESWWHWYSVCANFSNFNECTLTSLYLFWYYHFEFVRFAKLSLKENGCIFFFSLTFMPLCHKMCSPTTIKNTLNDQE